MANDDDTKRRLDAIQVQIDRLAKQITHVVNSEDRIKEAVAQLLTDVRQDTYRSVLSIYRYMQEIDDKREAGQREARILRWCIVGGILLTIVLLLFLR